MSNETCNSNGPTEDDFFDPDDMPGSCLTCGGTGVIVFCVDDMCRAAGEVHARGW